MTILRPQKKRRIRCNIHRHGPIFQLFGVYYILYPKAQIRLIQIVIGPKNPYSSFLESTVDFRDSDTRPTTGLLWRRMSWPRRRRPQSSPRLRFASDLCICWDSCFCILGVLFWCPFKKSPIFWVLYEFSSFGNSQTPKHAWESCWPSLDEPPA